MTHSQRTLPAVLCLFMLAACGGQSESEARPQPPPVEDTAFGDMVGTMDEARGVQDTMDGRKQELDQRLQAEEASTQ